MVSFNSEKWLDGFFQSLMSQLYPLKLISVYVVDNGSNDGTLALLEKWQRKLHGCECKFEFCTQGNLGYGSGQNKAISMGDSKFVLIANPDIEFDRCTLQEVIKCANADDHSTATWELRQKPYEHPKHYDPVSLETNWSSHACVLVRRSAWQSLGGYDESFFMYAEDVELSYRLRRAGYRLRYCPRSVVWHFSYAHAEEIKPAQYVGSIIGNFRIRWCYGSVVDKLVGFVIILQRLFGNQPYRGARKQLVTSLLKLKLHVFSCIRSGGVVGGVHTYFPFRGLDYEMTRKGAFVAAGPQLKESPLVSVIIRTQGMRLELLRQAMQTVMHQTHNNIELIVVEDGGQRCRDAVLKNQEMTRPQLRYYSLPKLGRSSAGNEGMRQAHGEYVMFLDDDDLLYADHIETLMHTIANNPDCVAAYSLAWRVKTYFGDDSRVCNEYFDLSSLFNQPYCYETLTRYNYIPIQSILFKRALYQERGGFDESLDQLEDWNLWLRFGYRNKFVFLPKITSLFRVPADIDVMDSRQNLIDKSMIDALASAEKWRQQYDESKGNLLNEQSKVVK
jgi:GT2 family glycosyltransferase